jgi:hypothetical protein
MERIEKLNILANQNHTMVFQRVFCSVFLLFCSYTVSSQVLISLLFGDKLNSDKIEFGLEGGFNFSQIGALDADKRLSNFNLGFYFDYRLKDSWKLYTGVLVKSNLGVSELSNSDLLLLEVTPEEEGGTYSQHINNFLVPALIKYEFPSRIYAEAGPQFGLMYKTWVQFDSDIDGTETRIRIENKDALNKFDVGGVVGFGYRLKPGKGMTLGIKYYQGFTNVIKGVSGSRNNSIYIKCNIPIGAGKAAKDSEG